MNVKKVGEKGYFLIFTTYIGGFKSNYYCEYKDGCYYTKTKYKESPIFCKNGEKMTDSNGNIYKKYIKIDSSN